MNKAILLDKDGTLIENVPYNANPELVRLLPGMSDALLAFHHAGYLLIVVSNQSGVALGYWPESALKPVEARIRLLLAQAGVPLAGFYYCPHHPEGTVSRYALTCYCRKPQPGLIFHAAKMHDLELGQSWVVGDILDDVQAGRSAGCKTILVDNGNETEWLLTPDRRPDYTVQQPIEMLRCILTSDFNHSQYATTQSASGRENRP